MKKLILLLFIPLVSFGQTGMARQSGQTAKEYFESGREKYKNEDYYGAIADYTKAIEIDPNYDYAYASRANAKEELGDLNGACADWKEAARLGNTLAAEWVADQCN